MLCMYYELCFLTFVCLWEWVTLLAFCFWIVHLYTPSYEAEFMHSRLNTCPTLKYPWFAYSSAS